MKTFPIPILNAFRDAYTHSRSILIPYRGGEESSEGILYRFQEENQERLLKVMFLGEENLRMKLLHFEARLEFVNFLIQNNVSVIEPLHSLKNNLYEKIEDENGIWVAYTMKRIHGKTMSPKIWDPEFIRKWGNLIGKCHRVSQNYPDWEHCIDPSTGDPYLTWLSEWKRFYNLCKEPEIKRAWEKIGEELSALPIQPDSFGFIHNDPHLWNLMVEGDKLTLVDFDVANHNWFINDIAISCQHILTMLSGGSTQPVHHREYLVNFLDEFLIGYYQQNDLSLEWFSYLDLFFAYRRVLNYLLMERRRRPKPGLQKTWKEMIVNHTAVLGEYEFHR